MHYDTLKVYVDKERLDTALRIRGLTLSQIARDNHYATSWLSRQLTQFGYLNDHAVIALEAAGIARKEYERD